nr:retrovirus-related Pol polyprotein from transposon TNT 1-94 [Tanacetum cinerariifolium]
MQTQTSNTLHNAIMKAGDKDRPPMLAPANERLKQGESINVQDLETNLYWEFGKFTSRDGESLEPYYSRFYKMMNELVRNQCDSQELKTISYQKRYDILKQHQNEVNELRAKRIAHAANPLVLVAQQQPVYHPQNHPTHYTQNSSTRSQQAATKNKGKAISKLIGGMTDDESKDQELEAHYMYMAQIQEVSLDAADSGPIFDTEPMQKVPNNDNYNVFSIECEHPEQSKSAHDTYPIEQDEHNVIIDSLDTSYDREQIDQNDDDDDLVTECELLASLVEKLKCEIDDNKNRNIFLETSNKVLVEKLKGDIEDFKPKNKSLESSNNRFKKANNKLSETNKLMYTELKKFQAELDRRNDVEYASKVEIDCAKVKEEMVADLRYFNSLELEVDSLKSQLETQKTQFLNEIDRLLREYYYADHMNAILGVYTELDEVTNLQYNWKPKSEIGNVIPNVSIPLGNASRTANILEHMTPRCSKHMMGNLKLLINFVEKFLGTVKFRNDQITPILGYGDLVQGAITIKQVYYVEGLNHKLFSVGQFCDADLEVAFRKSTCYIRDLKGNDLLTGYSTQSRAYRVFNKRTRVIVETIHVNFDELPSMASDHVSSDPVPQCQRTVLEHDSLSPSLQCQENVTQADRTVTMSNNLDLLFSPMFDELLNGSSQEELHRFDQLDVWELVNRPLCKNVISKKWLWKNKRDEENIVIRNKSRLVAKGYAQK